LNLGRNYAVALSKSMRNLPNTRSLELPGNRLGHKGGEAIFSSLGEKVRAINVDHNKIGSKSTLALTRWID